MKLCRIKMRKYETKHICRSSWINYECVQYAIYHQNVSLGYHEARVAHLCVYSLGCISIYLKRWIKRSNIEDWNSTECKNLLTKRILTKIQTTQMSNLQGNGRPRLKQC